MKSFSLKELAALTGFEARTIRNYIAEGLIRGPESMGRNAHYTEHHLKRLKTIKLLKDTYGMPLSEIRRYLMKAGDEDIEVVAVPSWGSSRFGPLQDSSPRPGDIAPPSARHESKLDDNRFEAPSGDLADSPIASDSGPLDQLITRLRDTLRNRRVPRTARYTQVFEIEITPELSLSVRGTFDPETMTQFELLADHLREILLGGLDSDDRH